MRYRLVATYLGVPYHAALGPDGNEATLFSPAPPPEELGFTAAGGHWRKQVNVTDLDALWQSRLVGEYRGESCLVLDDLGDRLHIVYLGRDSARARQLGYWEIDREVFEVVAARQDIAGLTEERVEYPLASALFPPSNRDPVAQARPETPGRSARRAPPTGWRPGTARPRPSPGQSPGPTRGPRPGPPRGPRPGPRGPNPGLTRGPTRGPSPGLTCGQRAKPGPSRGPRRRLPRRPGGAPGGGTGCPSRSSPNSSAWPPSRTRLTRSMRRCRAPCAWSRQTAASRCSAGPMTPGWTCAPSRTRKRRTSTCSASWRPRRSAAGGCGQARPTGTSTDRGGPARPRPLRKTFRSTYGPRSYPIRHLIQLSLNSRRG